MRVKKSDPHRIVFLVDVKHIVSAESRSFERLNLLLS